MSNSRDKYPLPVNPDEYVPGEDEGLEFEDDDMSEYEKFKREVEETFG